MSIATLDAKAELSVNNRCIDRYKGAEGTILVGEHYER